MSIDISIHAPRVGSDPGRLRKPPRRPDFNPRSPCGERLGNLIRTASGFLFQSTLPVWGATGLHEAVLDGTVISIHAPRVGSDLPATCDLADAVISIHAPRVGSDGRFRSAGPPGRAFQSTLPVWGATGLVIRGAKGEIISIHAPRVGSDYYRYMAQCQKCDFNPRSPCGERHCGMTFVFDLPNISIHAPRVGSDRRRNPFFHQSADFNPRSPCGERLPGAAVQLYISEFQSTLPVWGATIAPG